MAAGQVPTRRGSDFEDYQVELMEARGVGEQVDFDDPHVGDREAEYDPRLSTRPHGWRRVIRALSRGCVEGPTVPVASRRN